MIVFFWVLGGDRGIRVWKSKDLFRKRKRIVVFWIRFLVVVIFEWDFGLFRGMG